MEDKNEHRSFERRVEERAERFEKNAERFGENVDANIKKLPAPIQALGDSVCIAGFFFVLYWVLRTYTTTLETINIGWIVWLVCFVVVFAVSVIIRRRISKK